MTPSATRLSTRGVVADARCACDTLVCYACRHELEPDWALPSTFTAWVITLTADDGSKAHLHLCGDCAVQFAVDKDGVCYVCPIAGFVAGQGRHREPLYT